MSEKIEPVACPKCGAPCATEVHPRGGDWGWGTSDLERTTYRYDATTVSALEARIERLMEALANAESGMAAMFESGDYGMSDDTIEQGFAILEDIRGSVPEVKNWTSPALTGATKP